jgi:hypothetical protein
VELSPAWQASPRFAANREELIRGMMALPGNPYDGHTLTSALAQVEHLSGSVTERGTAWISGASSSPVSAAVWPLPERRTKPKTNKGHSIQRGIVVSYEQQHEVVNELLAAPQLHV